MCPFSTHYLLKCSQQAKTETHVFLLSASLHHSALICWTLARRTLVFQSSEQTFLKSNTFLTYVVNSKNCAIFAAHKSSRAMSSFLMKETDYSARFLWHLNHWGIAVKKENQMVLSKKKDLWPSKVGNSAIVCCHNERRKHTGKGSKHRTPILFLKNVPWIAERSDFPQACNLNQGENNEFVGDYFQERINTHLEL